LSSDADLAIFSVRSLTAFFMFLGWTAYLTLKWGRPLWLAIIAGVLAGVLAIWLAYRLIRFLLSFQSSGTLELQNAIGKRSTL
jgi:membrane protein implicated in regulation of membrane protease activity